MAGGKATLRDAVYELVCITRKSEQLTAVEGERIVPFRLGMSWASLMPWRLRAIEQGCRRQTHVHRCRNYLHASLLTGAYRLLAEGSKGEVHSGPDRRPPMPLPFLRLGLQLHV
jgi:hypothetical protein